MAGRYSLPLMILILTPPAQCISYQLLPASRTLDGLLTNTNYNTTQDNRLQQMDETAAVVTEHSNVISDTKQQFESINVPKKQPKVTGNSKELGETSGILEERSFPYRFEGHPPEHQQEPSHRRPHINPPAASDRISLSEVTNTLENLNLPKLPNLAYVFKQQESSTPYKSSQSLPSRPLTGVERNFLFVLASIAVKLVMSTALASWFLAAGQALYGLATITGTPNIFGMDSAIKFIYLTVPFAEALLRGETELTG